MNNDHFWNIGVDEDGHHQFVQTVATNDSDKSLETNAALATAMDLVYYSRFKTSTESVDQQDCQPFAVNNSDVMQLLGIRACAVFDFVNIVGAQTLKYTHNVTSVTRQATGKYTINFASNLPSTSYLVLGGGMRSSATPANTVLLDVGVQNAPAVGTIKKVGSVQIFTTRAESGVLVDPLQAWIVCFGG